MLEISEEQIYQTIAFENPWWETGKIHPRISEMPKRSYFWPAYALIEQNKVNRSLVLRA